ncbi:MAG: metallopeptidase [Planctomycetota bacterium]|jgi:hypothetical protein|nr:metallopeptidase [Planctomycetota bacterium]MDP6763251.1 metallopeptidase [Planctomycetota bacterium]MDP6990055.1 metallopeptidase [Planctomycetota bacterium]
MTRNLLFVLVLAGCSATAQDVAPRGHATVEVEGWTVSMDRALVDGVDAAVGAEALATLTGELAEIAATLPRERVEELRRFAIRVDADHALDRIQYHPDVNWLIEHRHDPALAKTVHIPRARDFVELMRTQSQPWVMLHELAHAWHDAVLGFDHEPILRAWERAVASKRFESVVHVSGQPRRHYGLTNHMEYFAETSEAYFGKNDYYPFDRAELAEVDPEGLRAVEAAWRVETR